MSPNESLILAVVDDDDDVRMALSRLLRAMGHEVRLFTSAEEFEAEDPVVDCVIADVRLPGVSGLELRERLRTRNRRPPVVLITGDGDRLARDFGNTLDTPVLTKPFDAAVLAEAVRSVMSTTAFHRERHAH
ncbi:MAG TPA: response regulator [Vicinamibacterales bacterium]|nr:response regulator [Vicinamibacterales bacterium]